MLTPAQIALLRLFDKTSLVGIDTSVGDPTTPQTAVDSFSTSAYASVRYIPSGNELRITQDGAVLSGINFGDTEVVIEANNVTIKNSTFQAGSSYFGVLVNSGYSGTIIENNTFNGGSMSQTYPLAAFIYSKGSNTTIANNEILNSPGDAIDSYGGTITGNYIAGGGHSSIGTHPDGIWITDSQSPTVISNNVIDWTWANGASSVANGKTNNALRITSELGNVSNVSVSNNVLVGGGYTIDAGNAGSGTFSNVNISNNYVGMGYWGDFIYSYGADGAGVTTSNNVSVSFYNPVFSSTAWTAYQAAGVGTDNLIVSKSGADITGASGGSSTLYGAGTTEHLFGTANETIFVGGAGKQYLVAGAGTNIFRYLSFGDSVVMNSDGVSNFKVAKDVIDLSRIDADPSTAGVQNLKFIGSGDFSAAGGEVRFVQDASAKTTTVQATMAGSSTVVFQLTLSGLVNLTQANFALTSAQSNLLARDSAVYSHGVLQTATSYLADGSSQVRTYNADGSYVAAQRSVSGQVVSESAVDRNGNLLAAQSDSGSGNAVSLYADGVTINAGKSDALKIGSNSFNLSSNSNMNIDVNGHSGTIFNFSQGFGHATISDLAGSSSYAHLNSSLFSYLNSGMSQAQDLSAMLAHATSSASGLTISDSSGDTLTISGMTATKLLAEAARIAFV